MPSEDTKILEFSQYQKTGKAPFMIYADYECIKEKIYRCKNDAENSSTTSYKQTYSIRFFNLCNVAVWKHRK